MTLRNFNLKRFLVIYTIIVLVIGIFVSVAVLKEDRQAIAATGWNTVGEYLGCNANGCTCYYADGCEIYLHVCDGWQTHAQGGKVCISSSPVYKGTLSEGQSMSSDSILSGVSCAYVQIDSNVPGSPAGAGNLGGVTLEWANWDSCYGEPEPEPDVCPYGSTQARVQSDITDPWKQNMNIACGESFRVGAFHDGTGQFANDTELQVVGPGVNTTLGNEGVVTTGTAGTYTVYAKTRVSGSSNFYSETACKAQATVTCTQSEDVCPYNSSQARVQKDINDPWKQEMVVNCGETFRVGGFHDATGQFANDTQIQVVGPGVNKVVGNEAVIATSAAGTYSVFLKTRVAGTSDFYPESACRAGAQVVCKSDVPNQSGFEITKVVTNDNGVYDIGDRVNFRVEITNTGDVVLSNVPYRDVFDSRYLVLESVMGSATRHAGENITNKFTKNLDGTLVTLTHNDLTNLLGDLRAGEKITLEFSFKANQASHSACNDAFSGPNGLSEKQARACVGIILNTDM